MSTPERARRLTIYVGETDQWHHRPLFVEIVHRAHAAGLAGATAIRGFEGYGGTNSHPHAPPPQPQRGPPRRGHHHRHPGAHRRLPAHPRRGHDRRDGHARGRRGHPLLRPDTASPVQLGHGCPPPAGRPHRLDVSASSAADDLEHGRTPAVQLAGADPRDAASSSSDPGAVGGDLPQGGVVEDHVRRQPGLLGDGRCARRAAARTAPRRRRPARPRRRPGPSSRPGPRAARRRCPGHLATQRDGAVAAQHRARTPRSAPACRSRRADGQQPLREQLADHAAPLASSRSAPMPKTVRVVCSSCVTRGVWLPRRMSMTWPAPNRCRRWSRRTTADSSFCAATVPSQVSGGDRQVSQLPHGVPPCSPK